MAAFEVIALDTATPQLRAPGASDTYTFPRAVEMPLGTANSVLFLNGSKVVSSGSGLTFDGTNLGIGTSSPAYKLDVNGATNLGGNIETISGSTFYNSTGDLYIRAGTSGALRLGSGGSNDRLFLDASGNLGLGVTPSAWNAAFKAFEAGTAGNGLAAFSGGTPGTILTANAYYDSVGWKYGVGGAAVNLDTSSGYFRFNIAPSGTAGNAISFTQALTLDANRNLALNTTSVGTSAVGVLSVGSGTEPSSGPADTVQIYSVDRSAGNTIPAIYCEGSGVTNAGITNVTVTNKIAIKVNGTVYYLLATTNAT